MTRQELIAYHENFCGAARTLLEKKNSDYTAASASPFSNFERVEIMGICSTEQGMLARIIDKLSRLSSFVTKGELCVADERVEDTLLDLVNYAVLMAAYVQHKDGPQPEMSLSYKQG